MKTFFTSLTLGLSALLLMGCVPEDLPRVVTPSGDEIRVEVVADFESRQRGLMFRESLDEDAGMLFVFESEMMLGFWMKNTLIPLDILYIDNDRRIVDIQTMQPCEADPCPSYPTSTPARFALEINAGKAEDLGLKIGDELHISLPSHDEPQS